jgi:short subunit fatty acids transporter
MTASRDHDRAIQKAQVSAVLGWGLAFCIGALFAHGLHRLADARTAAAAPLSMELRQTND